MFTAFDVDNLFENYVTEVSFGELKHLDSAGLVVLQAISSGVSIGQCNWILRLSGEVCAEPSQPKLEKIGLLTNLCLDGEYRYPKGIEAHSMLECDALIASSGCLVQKTAADNLQTDIQNQQNYGTQILSLLDKLNQCLCHTLNSKVLMPVQPTFLLELVDLLLHKLNKSVHVIVLSDAA